MTTLPFRMSKNRIKIQQVTATPARVDPYFREVEGKATYGAETVVYAQITFKRMEQRNPSFTGDLQDVDGHLCFKQSDLTIAGITIKKGDIITGVYEVTGSYRPVSYEITHVIEQGHLPASLIVLAYFKENLKEKHSV